MPIARLENESRPSRASPLPQGHAVDCGSEPAREGARSLNEEPKPYPINPRMIKNNNEGPSKHPSAV
jgi:hypothetical protein